MPRKPAVEKELAGAPGTVRPPELARVSDLRPHPRNYKNHPEDQLLHIVASLNQFGQYRNVVVAREGTILAGHGVVQAMTRLGWEQCLVVRLDLDPDSPAALKLLALDNELPKFAETDDRALTEILKYVRESSPEALLGTGFDEQNLAALLMVTRPTSEIADSNAAAEWVGMPEYDTGGNPIRLTITFVNEEDRKRFVDETKLTIDKVIGVQSWSTRWPFTQREDASSIRFEVPE